MWVADGTHRMYLAHHELESNVIIIITIIIIIIVIIIIMQMALHHVSSTHQLAAPAEHPGSRGQVPDCLPCCAALGSASCLGSGHQLHHPAVLLPPRCACLPAGLPHAALPLHVQVLPKLLPVTTQQTPLP